jgi:uncharacterized circularly permuted ATP-grasp superfamily protein
MSLVSAPPELSARLGAAMDEALDDEGRPRPAYESLLAAVEGAGLEVVSERVAAWLDRRGIVFTSADGDEAFRVDPVPRLISSDEWKLIERGLSQRAAALNAFIRDVYGSRELIAAGRIDETAVCEADHYEVGVSTRDLPQVPAPVIGFDLVRGADGGLRVLEDNLRTPSGITYAIAARGALDDALPGLARPGRLDPEAAVEMLRGAVEAELERAPGDLAVLLTDGPGNNAYYEHRVLSRALGMPLVERGDLRQSGRRLLASIDGADRAVGLVVRRTDTDELHGADGGPTWLGELFAAAARAGVAIVNAPGAGVADDKLTHAYVEEMIRFYLGEEPVLPSVRTFDLGAQEALEEALARLGELVVKPRSALGGDGVVIGPVASADELERVKRAVRERPRDFVAQEPISLSTHPTVCAGALEPRHVDLRVFTIAGEVAPAPLTRVALQRGELIVNSSRDGGAKDTWVGEGR